MRRAWIYGLMGLISALLVVLIFIQLVWLKSAAAAEKRETQLHVEKALGRVEEQLRNANYCVVSYSKLFVNPGEKFFMIQYSVDGKADTLNMFYQSMYVDSARGKMKVMNAPFPFSMDIQLKSSAVITNQQSYYNERKEFYEKLTGKEYNDILATNRSIDSIFDMLLVDSLLKASLLTENKDTTYGFAFIDKKTNKVMYASRIHDTVALLASPYAMQLFTDNKFIKPYRLALLFPKMPGIYGVNSWLWLSIGVVVLLTFSFYAFIRLYIRQTKLSEMKSDFINNLTHEFNTPMANIALAIETLESNSRINPKVNNIMNIISAESERLRENIERSLQIATLEKGNLQLHKERIDMVQTVNAVMSSYQLQCEQVGGKIEFLHNGKAIVYGDETHLLNCVVNLLDNAVKYRNGRMPEITVDLEEKAEQVVLTVSDNGIGMSADAQKHIFEKFYRAHEGDTHNTKGFGLGLSYVKGIIDAHGGKIEVWSKEGVGTRFTIKLQKAE